MPLDAASASNLLQKGATARDAIFKQSRLDLFDGSTHYYLLGYYSPVTNKKQIQEAGFIVPHDAIVRINKNRIPGLTPALGWTITVTEQTGKIKLRIAEFSIHSTGPEWAIGCKAII